MSRAFPLQKEMARALKAAKAVGFNQVVMKPDGEIVFSSAKAEQGADAPSDWDRALSDGKGH
jgi:hypothetical protein